MSPEQIAALAAAGKSDTLKLKEVRRSLALTFSGLSTAIQVICEFNRN